LDDPVPYECSLGGGGLCMILVERERKGGTK